MKSTLHPRIRKTAILYRCFFVSVLNVELCYYLNMNEGLPKEIKYTEKSDPGEERDVNLIMETVKIDSQRILEKIRNSIDNHKYGAILGIDGGGRVPALILGKTINNIYASKREEKIKTFFITGSRSLNIYGKDTEKIKQLTSYFKQNSFEGIKNKDGKVLIVEDVVASGASLKLIVQVLQDLKLQYDITTLSFDDSRLINNNNKEKDIVEIEKKLGSKIHYGEYGGVSKLYGSKQMQGVHKSPDLLFSKPLGKPVSKVKYVNIPSLDGHSFEFIQDEQNKEVLRGTRELVSKISEELTKEYLK